MIINEIPKHYKDISNQRFGSLVAIKPIGKQLTNQGRANVVWEFKCDCGNTHVISGYSVVAHAKKATNPKAPSCGCVNKETTRIVNFKHGYYKHPLFWVWVSMVDRCYNPNSTNYHKYGAKGVYVCDEWKHDAQTFIEWALNNGWKKGLYLDKDVLCCEQNISVKVYSPSTCKFLTQTESGRFTTKYLTKESENTL